MAPLPAANRRRSPRQWAALPVLIHHRGSRIDGVSVNLSEGGMYLFAAAHLPLGAQIEIEFHPPDGDRLVRVRGTVRRRALYLYGIEFLAGAATSSTSRAVISIDRTPSLYGESQFEFVCRLSS